MQWFIVLTALIGGLWATPIQASDDHSVVLVQTTIGITVTDSAGRALSTPDSLVTVIWDQFGKKPWPREHWSELVLKSGPVGTLVPTHIPLNQAGIRHLWWYAKVFPRPRVKLGFTVRDGQGQPMQSHAGIRIVIWQLGPDAWPNDLWVTVAGELDHEGHIVVPVNFPLNGVVVKNLTTLSKNQLRLHP